MDANVMSALAEPNRLHIVELLRVSPLTVGEIAERLRLRQTKLINRAQYVSEEALQTVLDMGMLQGTSETFDNLDAHLQQLQKSS
ncbi:ArsR family transcriptional regulator [Paenibacillus alkaliterrae]|uniref:ArsR family transcriptional regulator n=1 Tax=Paenibacillus alkaliterrae TaxID=320909 RepID=UPI001F24D9A7|nr:ArsR family transcriptional regulator [Paenibacillus alkaliterrae]MCF2938824.1 ArsR family transcriptional regulator [Paenibacillus alkaliterrae]